MLHDSMLYDVAEGHIILHIVVFDVEHPRKMSESTSYQLSKAKDHTFHDHKKAYLAILLNKARDSASQDKLLLKNKNDVKVEIEVDFFLR